MPSHHCPSHDWDAYCRQQDETMAAELRWWQRNEQTVIRVMCALLSNPSVNPFAHEADEVADRAVELVQEVTQHQEEI